MTQPWLRTEVGAPHPGIQVCIIPQRVLDLVWAPNEDALHPGDTFTADLDMSDGNLPTGQILTVGTAVLQVSEVFNDACVKWKVRYGQAAYEWIRKPEHRSLRLRGVLCSVEQDGVIQAGDILRKV
ncbi:hypothetical protein [uncultured Shimia sp.]|uniref:MOSC domain-containing protein n=1 Tax=uncultured Shimia sp. TaxID=573152 RepID=UPI0025D0D4A2|nr:hypothetical protein [uncultured Shimia sp.]